MKPETDFIKSFTYLAVGKASHFVWNLSGLLAAGIFFSMGILPSIVIGLLIGFIIPSLWIVCIYKIIKRQNGTWKGKILPEWICSEPGNSISMLLDILLLAAIWGGIAIGLPDSRWWLWIMTIVVPAIVLFLLRLVNVLSDIHNT